MKKLPLTLCLLALVVFSQSCESTVTPVDTVVLPCDTIDCERLYLPNDTFWVDDFVQVLEQGGFGYEYWGMLDDSAYYLISGDNELEVKLPNDHLFLQSVRVFDSNLVSYVRDVTFRDSIYRMGYGRFSGSVPPNRIGFSGTTPDTALALMINMFPK